jgi:hypothetical protein
MSASPQVDTETKGGRTLLFDCLGLILRVDGDSLLTTFFAFPRIEPRFVNVDRHKITGGEPAAGRWIKFRWYRHADGAEEFTFELMPEKG